MTPTLTDAEAVMAEQRNDIHRLREAIRLTREYVGEAMLPAVEGWDWYDAIKATGDCEGFGKCGVALDPVMHGRHRNGWLKHCQGPAGHVGEHEGGE